MEKEKKRDIFWETDLEDLEEMYRRRRAYFNRITPGGYVRADGSICSGNHGQECRPPEVIREHLHRRNLSIAVKIGIVGVIAVLSAVFGAVFF